MTVQESVAGYMMDIIDMTRTHGDVLIGAFTRGAMALYEASQVMAAFSGRDYVLPEDVKKPASAILAHCLKCISLTRQNFGLVTFLE